MPTIACTKKLFSGRTAVHCRIGLRVCLCFSLAFAISTCDRTSWGQNLAPAKPSAELYDTQTITTPLVDPKMIVSQSKLPPGFSMQVVASEPDVQQPIGMTWDTRGRLWIAENYTYSESSKGFDTNLSDRIIILEDTDGDGTLDKRKVFWDQGKKLTSIEIGNNGVWALAPPNLLFIPDANHDDIPDAQPRIVLDGFDEGMRHNVANGLRFGPDGWLYGRHGILGVSNVGIPEVAIADRRSNTDPNLARFGGPPPSPFDAPTFKGSFERTKIHCGVWRFHPETFEIQTVAQGTTNPWGMDWDPYGNLFFINTVIGHLWHAIPNSHLQRMYGEDLDPYTYELLPHIADHVHWDEKNEDWRAFRKVGVSSGSDAAGGGHAHSGMMIYQGDNWPAEYRNQLFTLNFHGQRINHENLVRTGAGYVGKHKPDMVFWKDPWFRGIELSTGPDGSVYVLDWSDLGECHDDDGIHRHSGRIYRIKYDAGTNKKSSVGMAKDLLSLSSSELLALLKHPNAWYAQFAQRILKDHHSLTAEEVESLRKDLFATSFPESQVDPVVLRLRALWALNATNHLDSKSVVKLLRSKEREEIHSAVIRLVADRGMEPENAESSEIYGEILELLGSKPNDPSNALTRLYLAALQPQLFPRDWRLANALAQSVDLANDRDFPLVMWYGVKDHVAEDPLGAAKFCVKSKIPKLNALIIRRLASLHSTAPEGLNWLVSDVAATGNPERVAMLLQGMTAGFQGRRSATAPKAWDNLVAKIGPKTAPEVREQSVLLQSIFGGGIAADQLIALAKDGNASMAARRSAVESLGTIDTPEVKSTLWTLLEDQFLGGVAATSIAKFATTSDAERLSEMYGKIWPPGKSGVIAALSSKADLMPVLLASIESNKIPLGAIDATTWRQFQLVADWQLLEKARKLNPKLLELAADKEKLIHDLEALLTEKALSSGDASRGRAHWEKNCATCHKLFGEGQAIGPELTGAQRTNLRYWSENILAPSAQVATNFRLVLFRLNDDTIINGVPIVENGETITIQTAKEKITIEVKEIAERKPSNLSLMPEGLLDPLDEKAKLDLFKYLMSPGQVPLAK